jgi:hypothetical protein
MLCVDSRVLVPGTGDTCILYRTGSERGPWEEEDKRRAITHNTASPKSKIWRHRHRHLTGTHPCTHTDQKVILVLILILTCRRVETKRKSCKVSLGTLKHIHKYIQHKYIQQYRYRYWYQDQDQDQHQDQCQHVCIINMHPEMSITFSCPEELRAFCRKKSPGIHTMPTLMKLGPTSKRSLFPHEWWMRTIQIPTSYSTSRPPLAPQVVVSIQHERHPTPTLPTLELEWPSISKPCGH